jgi:hypothetical protein
MKTNELHPFLRYGASLVLPVLIVATHPVASARTLHDFCTGSTYPCPTQNYSSNPVITTTSTNPTFGVTRAPDNNKGLNSPSITVVVLVPNNAPSANSLTFTVRGTGTGTSAATATLFSISAWTSGDLITSYFGLNRTGGPANPFNAFNGGTAVTGATGYFVYTANLGSVTFGAPDPTFSFTGISSFPVGSIFLSYVKDTAGGNAGTESDDTAPSSALLIAPASTSIHNPEPSSIALFGSGLFVLGGVLWRRMWSRGNRWEKSG